MYKQNLPEQTREFGTLNRHNNILLEQNLGVVFPFCEWQQLQSSQSIPLKCENTKYFTLGE